MELNSVHCTDLLTLCSQLEPASVDMILCDLPYGTTSCDWDSVIPFDLMWAAFRRVVKPTAAIVLTASQPFTSALVMSNVKAFRHEWVWIKNRGSNFFNTDYAPFKEHESVLVFAEGMHIYNPQVQSRTGGGIDMIGKETKYTGNDGIFGKHKAGKLQVGDTRVPSSWQKFNTEVGLHPTQKPVRLFEYLIRTYSNEGALIFDPCAGSGTTAIAARQMGRKFIVGDTSQKYCDVMHQRLQMPYTAPLFTD